MRPAVTPDANSYSRTRTFLQNEDADRYDELFYDAVVSGCIHPVPGSGTTGDITADTCIAYPGGYRINDSLATLDYTLGGAASTDVCWVAVTAAASGNSGNFIRIGSTHYAVDCVSSTIPSAPTDGQIILKTTITGGSISAVVDLRRLGVVARIGARSTFSDLVIANGDFAWASDTKTLWAGDGSTAGGVFVGGSGSSGITSIELVTADGVTFTGSPANPLTSNGSFTINLGTITPDAIDTPGHIASGEASLSDNISIFGGDICTDTSGTLYGVEGQVIMQNTTASTATGVGVYGVSSSTSASANVDSGGLVGVKGSATHANAFQNSNIYGGLFAGAMSAGNTDGAIYGAKHTADVNSTLGGTLASALYAAFNQATHSGTGTVPLIYGSYNYATMDAAAAAGTTLIGSYNLAAEGTGTATNLISGYYQQPENGATLNCLWYLAESTSNGINYICVKLPALGTNWDWTLPATDGTANQVLITDGNGVTSWADGGSAAGAKNDIAFWKAGFPTDAEVVGGYVAPRAVTCPDNFSGSTAKFLANFAATKAYDIKKNGSSIGSMDCASGGSTCTFNTTGTTTVLNGTTDYLTLVSPATSDTTARDMMVTLKCTAD